MASNTTTTTTTTTTVHGPTTTTTIRSGSRPQSSSQLRSAASPSSVQSRDALAWTPSNASEQPAIQSMDDHPRQEQMGHGHGEDLDQHAAHANYAENPVKHWGLAPYSERTLFYCFAIPSWCFEIVAGILGSYFQSTDKRFIPSIIVFFILSAAAWFQTTVQMVQRASWVRDESNLVDRRRFLYLAVRLNRLMFPTAVIAFCIFVVAYVRRTHTSDLANWLIFQLIFIINTVFCVMNAYNNITWESDRLEFEEGSSPYGVTMLAVLGIPTKPKKSIYLEE